MSARELSDLSDSSALLEMLCDSLPMGVSFFDADLRLLRWNQLSEDFTRKYWPGDYYVGQHLLDIIGNEDRIRRTFERVGQGHTFSQSGVELTNPDGTASYWDVTAAPLRKNGEIRGFILVINDRTEYMLASLERQERETRLRSSENELRALFAAMTDVVMVVDGDGRIIRVAPTNTSRLFDVAPDRWVGSAIGDIFDEAKSTELLGYLRRALESHETVRADYELPVAGRMCWMSATISPMSSNTALWVSRDVTDVVERESRAAEAEEIFRKVFEETADGIIINRVATRSVVEVNEACARMHGYTREEFAQLDPPQFIDPGSYEAMNDFFTAVVEGREFRARARDVRKDGSTFDIEVTGVPLIIDGELHAMAFVRDVTEQVRAMEDLELSVEERTRELATLLDVARGVASRTQLEVLLKDVLDQVKLVLPYDGASISRVDGQDIIILESRGGGGDVDEIEATNLRLRGALRGEVGEAIFRGEYQYSPDIRKDNPYGNAFRRVLGPLIDTEPFEYIVSQLMVPLMARGKLVGVMTISRSLPNAFSEHEIHLAMTFASHVGVAMENAELLAESATRTKQLTSLLQMARTMSSTMDLNQLLDEVLDQLREVVDYGAASIEMLDMSTSILRTVSRRGPDAAAAVAESVAHEFKLPPEMLPAMEAGEPIICEDAHDDSFLARMFRETVGPTLSTRYGNVRSWVAVPLRRTEELFGFLLLTRPEVSGFSSTDVGMVSAFASQLSVALENSHLFNQLEQRAREMEALYKADEELHRSLELNEVLQALADVGVKQFGAESALLAIRDENEGKLTLRASTGVEPHALEVLREVFRDLPQQEAERGEVLVVPDVTQVPYMHPRLLQGDITRSFIAVPVRAGESAFGIYYAGFKKPHNFSELEVRLHQSLGQRAGVAIQNARLFEEARRRERETASLARIASAFELDRPLLETLDVVAELVVEATGAEAALVALTENGRSLATGSSGFSSEVLALLRDAKRREGAAPLLVSWNSRGPLIYEDVRASMLATEAYKQFHPFLERATWQGMASVPLFARGEPLGVLQVFYRPNTLPQADGVTLLNAVASQAAIALDNARLFAATQRRSRANEALARVSSSVMYNQPLPRLLQNLAAEVLEGTSGIACAVTMLDDGVERIMVIGTAGLPEGYDKAVEEASKLGGVPAVREAFRNRALTLTRNARDMIKIDPGLAPLRPLYEQLKFNCIATVPLFHRDRPNGALSVYYTAEIDIDAEEREILQALAGQIAVALENVRLFHQTEGRAREMETLYKADHEIFRSLELDEVLQALVRTTIDYLDADKGLVLVWDAEHQRLLTRAAYGVQPSTVAALEMATSSMPLAAIQEMFVLDNTDSDRPSPLRTLLRAEGVVTGIRMPIRSGDRLFGAFAIGFSSPHEVTQEERRVLQALTERAAVAISNAELYHKSQQVASLEERQRLARELHDSVSQALYGIALGARTARTLLDRDAERATEPVEYVLQLAEAGLAEMRALIFELRPESLETEGLVAALDKQVAATRARYGIAVDVGACEEPKMPLTVKEALFRIGQEALHNTVKHARASHVRLNLAQEDGRVSLEIEDDGQGFDPNGEFPGHLGLRSMRERMQRVGGTLEVDSAPGAGTRVRAEVPLTAEQAPAPTSSW